MDIAFANQHFTLLPQRALWWPAEKTLLVADVHLGKGAAFRALGQPVPRGSSRANLQLLSQLIAAHDARRLVILGDWTHAKAGISNALLELIAQWRSQHAHLQCDLVVGNHDRHSGQLPADLRFHYLPEPYPLADNLYASHEAPRTPQAGAHYVHGHIHPAVRLRAGAEALRLPCALQSASALLLPAFGAFTGTYCQDWAQWQSEFDGCFVFAQNTIKKLSVSG